MVRILGLFFWITALFLSIFLALSNWHGAQLFLHPFSPFVVSRSFSAPMFVFLSGAFFMGVVTGCLAMIVYRYRRKRASGLGGDRRVRERRVSGKEGHVQRDPALPAP